MNAQKFTQKSLEAVQSAQDTAIEYQNNAIEPLGSGRLSRSTVRA